MFLAVEDEGACLPHGWPHTKTQCPYRCLSRHREETNSIQALLGTDISRAIRTKATCPLPLRIPARKGAKCGPGPLEMEASSHRPVGNVILEKKGRSDAPHRRDPVVRETLCYRHYGNRPLAQSGAASPGHPRPPSSTPVNSSFRQAHLQRLETP